MDEQRFDSVVKLFSETGSRRGVLVGMLGGLVAGLRGAAEADAKRGHRKSRKGRKTHRKQQQRLRSEEQPKVALCHLTGSDSNELVYIEVSENAVAQHIDHHGDIFELDTNHDHCGRCYHQCGPNEECQEGQCVLTCPVERRCEASDGTSDCCTPAEECVNGLCVCVNTCTPPHLTDICCEAGHTCCDEGCCPFSLDACAYDGYRCAASTCTNSTLGELCGTHMTDPFHEVNCLCSVSTEGVHFCTPGLGESCTASGGCPAGSKCTDFPGSFGRRCGSPCGSPAT